MAIAETTRCSFVSDLPPSAVFGLEKHDDGLASIGQTSCPDTSSSAFFMDTSARTSTGLSVSMHTVGSICSVDHTDLREIGPIGTGTYCKVAMVTHDSNQSEMLAHKAIDLRRLKCRNDLNTAATELANEAKMLAGLDHENIIKLRGVSSECFSESFISGNGGYFLIMDILNETLRDRIDHHIKTDKDSRRGSVGIFRNTRKSFSKRFSLSRASASQPSTNFQDCQKLYNRIDETVLGIVRGMKYLHSQDIILRDLKPDNIGYENIFGGDFDGDSESLLQSTVKLFDFGMAKKVDECDPQELCGSPRYMAPEVMTGKGYTLAVDVYSFGVVLYELCSLKRPYEETFRKVRKTTLRRRWRSSRATLQDFYKAIGKDRIKPSDDLETEICCPRIRNLIEACWDHDPTKRPTFDDILPMLLEIFVPNLFSNPSSCDRDYLETLRSRDCTGKRSVSIEFDCPDFYNSSSSSISTTDRDTQSCP